MSLANGVGGEFRGHCARDEPEEQVAWNTDFSVSEFQFSAFAFNHG